MDLKLNTNPALSGDNYWDLSLGPDGDLELVDGNDAIGQDAGCRCKTVRGEWILDAKNGIPYFELIWVQNPNRMIVDYLFRKTILKTGGVASVSDINLDFDKTTRQVKVSPTVVANNGEVLVFTDLVLQLS